MQFYTQAVSGQSEIWRKSRPNAVALADPNVGDRVKQRLRLIEELRAFAASDLHLPSIAISNGLTWCGWCMLRRNSPRKARSGGIRW